MAKVKQGSAHSAKAAAEVLQRDEGATQSGGEVAVATKAAFALPTGLKLKKLVTVPSLALKTPGQGAALRFDTAMRISTVVDKKDSKREPATIANVTDMETGQAFILLVPAVVKENLNRDYAPEKDGEQPQYVGRIFFIQNLGKRVESQRYNDFGVAELESEESE